MILPFPSYKYSAILITLTLLLVSCKKENVNSNHVRATVVFRDSTRLVLDESGSNITFSMGQYQTTFTVTVKNDAGDYVEVGEGWIDPVCIFKPYGASEPYIGDRSLGYIFQMTDSTGKYREGNFDFKCVLGIPGRDTVRVYGNFSGYVE